MAFFLKLTAPLVVALGVAAAYGAQAKSVTTTVSSISITAPVEAVQPETGTFVLSVPTPKTTTDGNGQRRVTWTTEKTTVVTDADTTFRGLTGVRDIHVGDGVSVSGARQTDGSVHAASVSADGSASHISTLSVTAPVKSVDAAHGTFTLPFVETVNTVDENGQVKTTRTPKIVTVIVTPRTKFEGLAGLRDIHIGETVSAGGDRQPDGSLRASRVSRP